MSSSYISASDLLSLGYDPMPEMAIQSSICATASRLVDNFCLQPIGLTTSSENITVKTCSGQFNKIFTKNLPIVSIMSVQQRASIGNYIDIPTSKFEINNSLGYIEAVKNVQGNLKISYTHGYLEIPEQIKVATLLIASNLLSDWRRRSQTNYENVASLADNTMKMSFFNDANNNDIPISARNILMAYRRKR